MQERDFSDWSRASQVFPVLQYRLCFLQCDWRREISLRKATLIKPKGTAEPSLVDGVWVVSSPDPTGRHAWGGETLGGLIAEGLSVRLIIVQARWALVHVGS